MTDLSFGVVGSCSLFPLRSVPVYIHCMQLYMAPLFLLVWHCFSVWQTVLQANLWNQNQKSWDFQNYDYLSSSFSSPLKQLWSYNSRWRISLRHTLFLVSDQNSSFLGIYFWSGLDSFRRLRWCRFLQFKRNCCVFPHRLVKCNYSAICISTHNKRRHSLISVLDGTSRTYNRFSQEAELTGSDVLWKNLFRVICDCKQQKTAKRKYTFMLGHFYQWNSGSP